MRLVEHQQAAGGQTATAMIALQRLGLQTAYAGRFGSDPEGSLVSSAIQKEGVNIEFAEVIEGARNQIAFIIIDARNGERTIIWDRDDRVSYRGRRSASRILQPAVACCISMRTIRRRACVWPRRPALKERLSRRTSTISTKDSPNLLPLIDILITSKEFPHRLTGIADERASLVELKARYGCAIVGLTKGVQGAVVYLRRSVYRIACLRSSRGLPRYDRFRRRFSRRATLWTVDRGRSRNEFEDGECCSSVEVSRAGSANCAAESTEVG